MFSEGRPVPGTDVVRRYIEVTGINPITTECALCAVEEPIVWGDWWLTWRYPADGNQVTRHVSGHHIQRHAAWKRLVVTSTCVGRSTWNLELGASPNGGVWRASCRLALIDSCHAVWSMMRLRSQSECMRTSRKQQSFECGVWDVSWTGKHGRDKVGK